jgi:hypothetical protein
MTALTSAEEPLFASYRIVEAASSPSFKASLSAAARDLLQGILKR